MKRLIAYIPLLIGVAVVYFLAHRASELPLDQMLANAAQAHGVDVAQLERWHKLENHLEHGSTSALSDQDWNEIKHLTRSAEPYVRAEGEKALGMVKDGAHRDEAIAMAEKAIKDPNELVRAWAVKNLKVLQATDWEEKAKSLTSDPSKTVRDTANKLTE